MADPRRWLSLHLVLMMSDNKRMPPYHKIGWSRLVGEWLHRRSWRGRMT